MKSRKDRVNQIHFTAADHLQDACMYIKRGIADRSDSTIKRLEADIAELKNIRNEFQAPTITPKTQMFGEEEKIVCYFCNEEPAEFKNLNSSEYPYLCSGCKKWEVPDTDAWQIL